MCSFSLPVRYNFLFHDEAIACDKVNFKRYFWRFCWEEMQDCIVECFENPVQLEEMDLGLEKKIDVL